MVVTGGGTGIGAATAARLAAVPDDIAKVTAFVAVGDRGWLNGVDIVVDGGLTAGRLGGWVDIAQSPAMLARAGSPRG